MAPKAKKIFNNIKKQEKKIAKKEVKKAKTMIRKKKKWTVAASAFGYHGGYSGSKGFFVGKGGLTEHLQGGVTARQVPAASSSVFTPYYTRKPNGKNGLIVCGLQKLGTVCVSNTNTTWIFNVNGSKTSKIYINPDNFGGQMSFDARNYQFFKFMKIKLIFVMPSSAGTADGVVFTNVSAAVAHFVDPQIGSFQTIDYTSLQSSTDMFEFQVVQPFGPLTWTLKNITDTQAKWLNTELDSASDTSTRMCCQGIIYGFYDQAMAASTGTLTKLGDVLIEYELKLKDRSPDYGFTMQVGDLKLLQDMRETIIKRVERDQKDCKDPKDLNDLNRYMKKFKSTMLHLDRTLKQPEVKVQLGPPVTTIADPTYAGDPTKLATVSGGVLSVSAGSSAMDVNITKIGGTAVDSTASAAGVIPTTVKAGPGGGNYLNVENSTASIDVRRINNAAINTDGKTPSASMPVNINAVNQSTMATSANPTNGVSVQSAIPVQVFGSNPDGSISAGQAAIISGSGTSAHVSMLLGEKWSSAPEDTKSVPIRGPPSPTHSLNEEYVKIPKSAIKDVKTQSQKGPKGPSDEEEEDFMRPFYDGKEVYRRKAFNEDPQYFNEWLRRFNNWTHRYDEVEIPSDFPNLFSHDG